MDRILLTADDVRSLLGVPYRVKLIEKLQSFHPVEIAELLRELEERDRGILFRLLELEQALKERRDIAMLENGDLLVSARVRLKRIERILNSRSASPLRSENVTLPGNRNANLNTVILEQLGYVPKEGDEIVFGPVVFIVSKVENNRIENVRVRKEVAAKQRLGLSAKRIETNVLRPHFASPTGGVILDEKNT